jgi:hypothetical protein
MSKLILDLAQVDELVRANRYRVDPKTKFIARCIDGRYPNSKDLPALAIAGADAGEVALFLATSNIYGLELNGEKIYQSLVKLLGEEKNLRVHSDNHAKVFLGGCGHIREMGNNSDSYNLTNDQVDFIKKRFAKIKEDILEGEHMEGAVLVLKGDFGVYPNYVFKTGGGNKNAQVFVVHQSLIDERHKALIAMLAKDSEQAQYIYQVLSSTGEDHLFETAKRLAVGLPIYQVEFEEDGSFNILELGKV